MIIEKSYRERKSKNMKRLKNIVHKIFFPPTTVLLIILIFTVAAQFVIFCFDYTKSLVSYFVYLISAYELALILFRIVVLLKRLVDFWAAKSKLGQRYHNNMIFKAEISIFISFILNLIYSVYKVTFGFVYNSVWFASVAAYYIILTVTRFILLQHIVKGDLSRRSNLKKYRICGYLLLALTIVLSLMAYIMLKYNLANYYPGHIIYAAASYTVYNLYIAINNVIKYKDFNNLVISASKWISLSTALISLFTMQISMFARFGTGSKKEQIMSVLTAAAVFTIIFTISLFMIVNSYILMPNDRKVPRKLIK